ncbi:hypothetical protein V8C42DRAFT_341434 [Trichoderma barbatum]
MVHSEGFKGPSLIGTDPHGRVYGAFDSRVDSSVAIKKFNISTSAQGEQLRREIAALGRIRHRNIVPILYDIVRPKMVLLVMPVKIKGNLHTLMPLHYDMNLKTSHFYSLTTQMLSALSYLQEEGVSHRNVKPTNIFFDITVRGYHFQLSDFALTEPAAQSEKQNTCLIYKAPETYVDTYPLTTKQDVWSLFVTLAITCGHLSEADLSHKGPVAAAWAIVEAGVQLSELEAMAQQNPTLRASASAMFQQLRPKERVAEYPEFDYEYFRLDSSGRLEKDPVAPLGFNVDIRALAGSLGMLSRAPAPAIAVPEQYQYLPSDLGVFQEPTPVTIEPPNEGVLQSTHSIQLQQQQDYAQYQLSQYDPVNQRCLASCCNSSNTPRSLSWTSSSQPLSPHAPSFVPVSPPLAPTTPQPLRATTPTETWDIWGVYKITSSTSMTGNGEYVRPYPMACDGQEDQDTDDAQIEDYLWADDGDGVWTTLITNLDYLPGLLTLNHSLRAAKSKYPLVALYTDTFPQAGHDALNARGIPSQRIDYILPTNGKDYSNDPRFYDCWSKLVPFSLTQYSRIVQLDSDMLVLRNMDELMTLPLDDPNISESGDASSSKRVFAAGHACVCNPLRKPHYPKDWVPQNCAFTSQHSDPESAQTVGADPSVGPLGFMNGGLQVVNPSAALYAQILAHMEADAVNMDFADQSLLSDLYRGRWVPLPYTYNALKTLRWDGVHAEIWRDDQVKNIHYILSPKPWDEIDEKGEWTGTDESHKWWVDVNRNRRAAEKEAGLNDEF